MGHHTGTSEDTADVGGYSPARTLNAESSTSSLRDSGHSDTGDARDARFLSANLPDVHTQSINTIQSATIQKHIRMEPSATTLRDDSVDEKEKEVIVKEEVVDLSKSEEISEVRERLSGDGPSILYVDWDGPDDPQNARK